MEKYESKVVKIERSSKEIYKVLSTFSNFTPILQGKVDEWQATEDSCSFKVKGFNAKLKIVERNPYELVKITGEDDSSFDFNFWLQLKEVAPTDTKMKLTLHIKLNMMMKMMVGSKLQEGLDKAANTIADALNGKLNMPGI